MIYSWSVTHIHIHTYMYVYVSAWKCTLSAWTCIQSLVKMQSRIAYVNCSLTISICLNFHDKVPLLTKKRGMQHCIPYYTNLVHASLRNLQPCKNFPAMRYIISLPLRYITLMGTKSNTYTCMYLYILINVVHKHTYLYFVACFLYLRVFSLPSL